MKSEIRDTGVIFDIDHFAVHDGPGIRTSIFFKGCPLRCKWCHSPESQSVKPQVLFAPGRCIRCGACVTECRYGCQYLDNKGVRTFLHEKCVACMDCIKVCPSGAMFVSGRRMQVDEIMQEILPDKVYFKNSGGGVTLSGGEVLLQPEFADRILRRLKEEGIHTIVETSGFGSQEALLRLADSTDIFYYDYKLGEPEKFSYYTGGDLNVVLKNLQALRNKTDAITIRIPLIPGITDTKENVKRAYETAQKLNIKMIHLLPYNTAAGAKYEWCGRSYELGELEPVKDLNAQLLNMAPKDLDVRIMY